MWVTALWCALLLFGVESQSPPQTEATAGGFLAEEIPLDIVTTTPTAITRDTSVSIRDQQAITAVFSRPVIALGSDFGFETLPPELVPFTLEPAVPGRGRWVTTFIYRFDPDGPFATDLQLQFNWNLDLRSYDGVPLTVESATTVVLTTPTLSMNLVDVRSAMANAATDNDWAPFVGLESDILPEVPPDGVIELSFSAPVSLSVLEEALKVRDETSGEVTDIGVSVAACEGRDEPVNGEARCANITLSGDLAIGTAYALLLEAGVDYGEASGSLRDDLTATFGGLRRFVIPFIDTYTPRLGTPFYNLYIPHGLAEDTDLDDIPMELTNSRGEQLEFTLVQESKTQLRMITTLTPQNDYSVSVGASESVKDGFGFSLEASSLEFRTTRVFPSAERLTGGSFPYYTVFEASQDWGRQMLAFTKGLDSDDDGTCSAGTIVDLWTVTEPISAMPIFDGSRRMSFRRFLGTPSDRLRAERTEGALLSSRDVSSILTPTGVMAVQNCRYGSYTPEVFLETSLQVTVVGHDQLEDPQDVTVWVTSMETGEPVAEANVFLYGLDRNNLNEELLGEGETDSDGMARVSGRRSFNNLIAVVQQGSNFVYVPQVSIGQIQGNRFQDTLVVDRRLVRPGETLHVKGYVMERRGRRLVPARGLRNPELVFSPDLGDLVTVPVNLDREFGSYEAEIEIPEDAELREYSISFRAIQRGSTRGGARESITVGDPRLPTVELTVDTPFWVPPTGEIEIQVNVESFIGSAVGGSEISVQWTLDDFTRDFDEEPIEGELTIVTDDSGNGTAVIDLAQRDEIPNVGSTISIDFQYVGPTSELIEESASVRIEVADLSLSITRTVNTNIPGQTFGVSVGATDLQGAPLTGDRQIEIATISLVELPEDDEEYPAMTATAPLDGPTVSSCDFELGSGDYCDFELPSVGRFAIEACVEQGAATVCERVFMGRSQETWRTDPLESFLPVGFTDLTPEPLELGTEKEILVENPYSNAYVFVSWGTVESIEQTVMPLPTGRSSLTVEIDELCEFGCGLSVVVAIPRQTEGLSTELDVPVSLLFDPALPHTVTHTESIEVIPQQPREIDVTVSFPEAVEDEGVSVVGPGDNTTIEVTLDSEERTEVTLIAVDKAVLDLLPYPLKDIASDFLLELSTRFRQTTMSRFIVSPNGLQALIDTFNSRKDLDPWFTIASSFEDNFLVDLTEEDYIEQQSQYITIQFFGRPVDQPLFFAEAESVGGPAIAFSSAPGRGAVVARSASFETLTDVEFAEDAAAKTSVTAETPRLESDFVSTALFETEVTDTGNLKTTFTAPVNLGTFVIRAYAASESGIFGSAESEIIVRRELSLTPSVPRFVRTGDIFEAGAVITVSGSASATVSLSAELDGPLEFLEADILSVDVGADGQEEARFRLIANSVGMANLTLIADDGMGNTDALQLEIEIEGLQEAVTVGTSFTVEGQDMQSFVEGIDLPEAVPGSGDVLITAGVGRQPAVLALADQILDVPEPPFECPVSGDFALAAATIPGIVNPYDPWNASPGILDEDLTALIELILADFGPAVELLSPGGGLTTKREGLRVTLPCPQNDRDRDPSITQNARGVFLMNLVEDQLVNHALPEIQSMAATLLEARDIWRTTLSEAVENEAIEARNAERPRAIWIGYVAFARAALGADWTPSTEDMTIVDDLSMDRLSREFVDMSIESQAYYILARLAESDGASHPDVTIALQTWTDRLRITGRTAYISAYEGATAPASDVGNALAFLAMLRAGEEGQLLPRLGSYIASPPADNFGFRAFGTYPKLITMQALVEFDVSRGSAQPNLAFDAISGDVTLLSTTFEDASAAVASARLPWESLPDPPEPIEVSAVGEGEASVAITLNFVPAELLPFPTYRGIFVERSIQLEDAEEGDGPGLSTVPRGSVVSVKVQFLTPDALGETVVRVLMPAGLEPVDPNISGEGRFCPVPFFSLYSSFFFFNCPFQETRPSVVSFTFDSVRSGTTSVSFRAVAATTGVYTLPPTRVFAVEQPEVMGLSSAGTFNVCSGAGCDLVFVEPSVAPVSCPEDCSGSGACNLQDGVCLCFRGFTGDACEIPLET